MQEGACRKKVGGIWPRRAVCSWQGVVSRWCVVLVACRAESVSRHIAAATVGRSCGAHVWRGAHARA